MACPQCNYRKADFNCVHCKGRDPVTGAPDIDPNPASHITPSREAGEKLGEGAGNLIFWFIENKYTSFIAFYFGCFLIAQFVAPMIGLVDSWLDFELWPTWYTLIVGWGPIALMWVWRKNMPVMAREALRYGLILMLLRLFYWWIVNAGSS